MIRFLLIGLFIGFQVYLFFIKEFQVRDVTPYGNEVPYPLGVSGAELCQEFRTPGPLARIDIMLANYLKKPQRGTLRLSIFQGQKRIYFKNFPANHAEDNRFYTFDMVPEKRTPIPTGHYRFQLDYFPENPLDYMAVWVSEQNRYPYGSFIHNKEPQAGDMTFRVFYFSTFWQARERWLEQGTGFPAQRYVLLGSLFLLLLLVNGLFIYLTGFIAGWRRAKSREKTGSLPGSEGTNTPVEAATSLN